ncbi:FecCD family ABC transporter permease [Cellulophaga lytica]|uniref:ABC-type transporter, integral membrane subunit n=1 Tax=Cellulophaga lytica (strain ATCC 23178 / DSM 7489 / JCM 8516 / NBRC 14961 / NCIMB 1423 / VKM B-1433 / Cy l20) TaxID=867900 RepID=F0RGG5_CELLC|nr:iron ABC transporter permease [Cellulophaga lytica]ADY27990.1 ABC-type transporter, integral membrane subunit [Cellulophaga lytica DSM 7489]AIM59070.1 iron ABC transporter [Cellulophaga lytica]WQG77819.1 iron ABC transporter permease [Cellulophaga lytica]
MPNQKKYTLAFIVLLAILVICFCVSISLGSVTIPFTDTLSVIFGGDLEKESWRYIIKNYRIPKALTAILTGSGLALSGLLMQTLFRNPLAGPFVLGISSGASLGAAILIMGASVLSGVFTFGVVNNVTLAIASSTGSFLVLLSVLVVAAKVKDTMALLIIGLMFGSITAAIVSVLSYFTDAEQLQQYIYWSFGSLGNLSWSQLGLLGTIVGIGIFISVFTIKSLNAFLLGENYARSLGVHIKKQRFLIIAATGLLAGGITAFAGPIAFIGLAVPHLTRQVFNTTNHKILIPAVLLYGAILMLLCDTIAQLPSSAYVLPINAITSIIGAPVVIWLLVRKKKMVF